MTISATATGTPLPKANSVAQFVDPRTGSLSPHGAQLMNQWQRFSVGMNRITPCNASTASNVITLTPLTASPLLEKYVSFETFGFVADATTTGNVTLTVAPVKGTLSTLNVYMENGGVLASSGSIVAGRFYLVSYVDSLDGFVLFPSQHNMLQVRDGLSYGSFDEFRCYVNPGYCSSADGTITLPIPYELTCDIRITGVSTGAPVLGSSPYIGGWLEKPTPVTIPADGVTFYFYLIRKTTAPHIGEIALVTSTFDTASGIVPYIPSGWVYFAPCQHAVVWHTLRGAHWQGFPDFFNPPRSSKLILTGSGESSGYLMINGGDSAGVWATLNLASWVPNACRDPIVFGRCTLAPGAAAGGGWIRPNSTSAGGYIVGFCNSHATETSIDGSGDIWLKTDGSGNIQWMTTGDCVMYLWIKGYHFSEPR
jgi:hypothetical protein